MKDWCMKHPILAFLIVDEVITCVENSIRGIFGVIRKQSTVDEIVEFGGEQFQKLKNKKKQPEEDRTIGFKVS